MAAEAPVLTLIKRGFIRTLSRVRVTTPGSKICLGPSSEQGRRVHSVSSLRLLVTFHGVWVTGAVWRADGGHPVRQLATSVTLCNCNVVVAAL